MANKFLQQPYPNAQSAQMPGLNALANIQAPSKGANITVPTGSADLRNVTFAPVMGPVFDPAAPLQVPAPASPRDMAHLPQVQSFLDQTPSYDPSKDPIIPAVQQTGQSQLDAGLLALRDLFGEQRKEVEGRSFHQGLGGSGIEEGLFGNQYRGEQRQVGQAIAENQASTQASVTEAMMQGKQQWHQQYQTSITEAQTMIDWEYKEGMISAEQRRLELEELNQELQRDKLAHDVELEQFQNETNRMGMEEERKRTALQEAETITGGGRSMQDYLTDLYPGMFNWDQFSSPAEDGGPAIPMADKRALTGAIEQGQASEDIYTRYRDKLPGRWSRDPNSGIYVRTREY